MSNFWDKESDISEYELLEESIEDSINEMDETPIYDIDDIDDSILEEIMEESSFELNDNEAITIYNARLRLEQANLYEILINHDFFEGFDFNQQAIKNVQGELKSFIITRLEILLGIRKPVEKTTTTQNIVVKSKFNNVEVEFLKALAYKGTKGASISSREEEEEGEYESKVVETPVKKKNTIKPISLSNKNKKILNKPVQKTTRRIEEPLPTRPKETEKKKTVSKQTKKPVVQKSTTKGMTIEEIAKKDIEEMKSKKAFNKMSAKEKAAEILRVNNKYSKKPTPETAMPMMSPDQQQSKYLTEQTTRSMNSETSKFNNMIAASIVASKKQGDY